MLPSCFILKMARHRSGSKKRVYECCVKTNKLVDGVAFMCILASDRNNNNKNQDNRMETTTLLNNTTARQLKSLSRIRAIRNFSEMLAKEDTFFQLSVVRTLLDVHNIEWYASDLDLYLQPYQGVSIEDIPRTTIFTITEAVFNALDTLGAIDA